MARPKIDNAPTMSQRVNEWRKKTSVAYTIKLNKSTQQAVIDKLNSLDNKTAYIVGLIEKDIGYVAPKELTLGELAKQIDSGDIITLIFEDNSIMATTKSAIVNDNRIVEDYSKECHEKFNGSDFYMTHWTIYVRFR